MNLLNFFLKNRELEKVNDALEKNRKEKNETLHSLEKTFLKTYKFYNRIPKSQKSIIPEDYYWSEFENDPFYNNKVDDNGNILDGKKLTDKEFEILSAFIKSVEVESEKKIESAEKELKRRQSQRDKQKQENAGFKELMIEKYGKEMGLKLSKKKIFSNMTREMLIDIKGNPKKVVKTSSTKMIKEEYCYDLNKNKNGSISYKLKVTLLDGIVEKWIEG